MRKARNQNNLIALQIRSIVKRIQYHKASLQSAMKTITATREKIKVHASSHRSAKAKE